MAIAPTTTLCDLNPDCYAQILTSPGMDTGTLLTFGRVCKSLHAMSRNPTVLNDLARAFFKQSVRRDDAWENYKALYRPSNFCSALMSSKFTVRTFQVKNGKDSLQASPPFAVMSDGSIAHVSNKKICIFNAETNSSSNLPIPDLHSIRYLAALPNEGLAACSEITDHVVAANATEYCLHRWSRVTNLSRTIPIPNCQRVWALDALSNGDIVIQIDTLDRADNAIQIWHQPVRSTQAEPQLTEFRTQSVGYSAGLQILSNDRIAIYGSCIKIFNSQGKELASNQTPMAIEGELIGRDCIIGLAELPGEQVVAISRHGHWGEGSILFFGVDSQNQEIRLLKKMSSYLPRTQPQPRAIMSFKTTLVVGHQGGELVVVDAATLKDPMRSALFQRERDVTSNFGRITHAEWEAAVLIEERDRDNKRITSLAMRCNSDLVSCSAEGTVHIFNFAATNVQILGDIAKKLAGPTQSGSRAMHRFCNLTQVQVAKNEIYGELYHILKPLGLIPHDRDYWGCGEHFFHDQTVEPGHKAEAIWRWLEKHDPNFVRPQPKR